MATTILLYALARDSCGLICDCIHSPSFAYGCQRYFNKSAVCCSDGQPECASAGAPPLCSSSEGHKVCPRNANGCMRLVQTTSETNAEKLLCSVGNATSVSVGLTWAEVPGASLYELQLGLLSASFEPFRSITSLHPRATVSDLLPGRTYSIAVRSRGVGRNWTVVGSPVECSTRPLSLNELP